MKISIEYKHGKYTVAYGTLSATAASVKDAIEALVEAFRKQMEIFFTK